MKRLLLIFLTLIVFLVLFNTTAFADYNEQTFERLAKLEITIESLNLRDDNGEFIITIPGGEFVTVLDSMPNENERVHVEWNGYTGTVIARGLSKDIIFVVKADQHIYLFQNHKFIKGSPVITGTLNTKFETPSGIYSIYQKARDTILSGPDYEYSVEYWMPFYMGYGLCDADSWQTAYGGNIYEENGSHGSVNMPAEMAKTIYENCGIGYLVVVI